MFGLQSLFGVYDQKTLSDMFIDNEEYLETFGRKIPIIRRLFEEQAPQEDQGEANVIEAKKIGDQSKQDAANESFVEKIKRGVTSWLNKDTNATGNILDKEEVFAPDVVVIDARPVYIGERHSLIKANETPDNRGTITFAPQIQAI